MNNGIRQANSILNKEKFQAEFTKRIKEYKSNSKKEKKLTEKDANANGNKTAE